MTMTSEEAATYNDLIIKVEQISEKAALYLKEDAPSLGSFIWSIDELDDENTLATAFSWEDTPQGQKFWEEIWIQLEPPENIQTSF